MIKRVEITNFMSHEETILDLHPGVNVIVGPSDNGKSALMTALRWCFTNRPRGDGYRSLWGGETSVYVELDDGQTIERTRSNDENTYVINGGEPELAGKLLPITVDEFLYLNELNFLHQMDPPFMLSWKPGERGAFINDICRFDMIDTTMKNASKTLRDEKWKLTRCEEQVEEIEFAIEGFPDVDALDKLLSKVEQLESEKTQDSETLAAVRDLVNDIANLQLDIDECRFIIEFDDAVSELERINGELAEYESTKKTITHLIDEIDVLGADMREYQTIINYEGECAGIMEIARNIEADGAVCAEISQIVRKIQREMEKQAELDEIIESMEIDYDELIGDTCPLCGSKLE